MKIWVLNPPFFKKFSRPQRSPAVTKSGTIYYPIWLAYCVGVLEQNGFDIEFTDAPARGISHEQILKMASEISPSLIVMDTSTPSITNDLAVAEQIKKIKPETFIVMVGTHVSACAEETLAGNPHIDAIARKEYEFTILELAQTLAKARNPDLAKIAGLSYRNSEEIIHNPDRPFISNLDDLPWVSRIYKKYLRPADYFNPNSLYPMLTMITSRGCPYRCSFCVYPQTLTGRAYRFRSIKDVTEEMLYIQNNFPEIKCIFFEDDTLTSDKKRCLELAESMRNHGISIPWTANSRADLDRETMTQIRKAGCRELCVGFESGKQETLNGIRKGVKVEKMFKFMEEAKQAGILIHGCFMVGFPGESAKDIHDTIDMAKKLKPDTVQFYPVMVYPGTEAYDEYVEKDWLTAEKFTDWLTPEGLHNCVVKNENLSSRELVNLCDEARRRFYLRPGYFAYKLGQLIKHPGETLRTLKAARVFFKHLLLGSKL